MASEKLTEMASETRICTWSWVYTLQEPNVSRCGDSEILSARSQKKNGTLEFRRLWEAQGVAEVRCCHRLSRFLQNIFVMILYLFKMINLIMVSININMVNIKLVLGREIWYDYLNTFRIIPCLHGPISSVPTLLFYSIQYIILILCSEIRYSRMTIVGTSQNIHSLLRSRTRNSLL
jgi:hypothetical protein